eukprot:m.274623 g.274623  ORF g.274623 m.274623 type:complete len:85 (-) comp19762_c0_seq14:1198-1452(-)
MPSRLPQSLSSAYSKKNNSVTPASCYKHSQLDCIPNQTQWYKQICNCHRITHTLVTLTAGLKAQYSAAIAFVPINEWCILWIGA